jgi:hypothetical protein
MKDKIIMLSGEVQYPVTVENPHEVVLNDNKSIFIAYANDIMVALSDEHINDDNDILIWKEVPEELENAITYFDIDDISWDWERNTIFN